MNNYKVKHYKTCIMEQTVKAPLVAFKDSKSGKWGFKNSDDEVVVPPTWCHTYYKFDEGMCAVANEDKKIGFVDETGQLVIPCQYVSHSSFCEGLVKVQEAETFKIGYINHKGETVIPFVYRKGGDFEDGLAMVSSENGMWGAISKTNRVIFSFKYGWKELYDILHSGRELNASDRNNVEKQRITLHVCDEDIEMVTDKCSIERWQKAAEVVSRKYDEYTKLSWCKGKSSHTIGLVTMLDFAYNGLKDK